MFSEHFWVDLVLENPLDVAVTLANLSVTLGGSSPDDDVSAFMDIETIEEVYLNAREKRTVCAFFDSVKANSRPYTFVDPNLSQIEQAISPHYNRHDI